MCHLNLVLLQSRVQCAMEISLCIFRLPRCSFARDGFAQRTKLNHYRGGSEDANHANARAQSAAALSSAKHARICCAARKRNARTVTNGVIGMNLTLKSQYRRRKESKNSQRVSNCPMINPICANWSTRKRIIFIYTD
jgi:hypothetical protein